MRKAWRSLNLWIFQLESYIPQKHSKNLNNGSILTRPLRPTGHGTPSREMQKSQFSFLATRAYLDLFKNTCNSTVFIYLGFYVAFNTVQVISRRVVGRAEETSTYSSLGFCTINCRPTASNYQPSHLRPCWGSNLGLRGGRRECYHSATVAPVILQ